MTPKITRPQRQLEYAFIQVYLQITHSCAKREESWLMKHVRGNETYCIFELLVLVSDWLTEHAGHSEATRG